MEQAMQLFGYLVLTLLSFVAPVLTILLSIFSEGILKLTEQYKNEESKSESNIKEQLKKQGSAESTDLEEIKKSVKELESIKKIAERKLSLLNPRKQIPILFILLLLSFLGIVSFLVTFSFYKIVELLISLICFGYAVSILWKLFGIIIEAKKAVDDAKKDTDTKIVELLSKLVEKGSLSFLKNVTIRMNDV